MANETSKRINSSGDSGLVSRGKSGISRNSGSKTSTADMTKDRKIEDVKSSIEMIPAGKFGHVVTRDEGWSLGGYSKGHKVNEFDEKAFNNSFETNASRIDRAIAEGRITWQEGQKMLGDWLDSSRDASKGLANYVESNHYDNRIVKFAKDYRQQDDEATNKKRSEDLLWGNPEAEKGTLENAGLYGAIDRQYQQGQDEIAKREGIADDMMADAGMSEQDKNQFIGEASGNVVQSFQKAKDAEQRQMGRFGIDPNSGKYVSSGRAMNLGQAASEADAKNRTRLGLRQMEKDNVNTARMVRIGLNPTLNPGSAVGAYTGAGLSGAGFMQNQNSAIQNQRNVDRSFSNQDRQFGLSQDMWDFSKDHYWDNAMMDVVGGGVNAGIRSYNPKG